MTQSLAATVFDRLAHDRLQWLPELGVGYYPVDLAAQPYDARYWERYQQQDATEMGEELTNARIDWVQSHGGLGVKVCDVGIGGGRFLGARPLTVGYDVNPQAVEWLQRRQRWHDITLRPIDGATFWDSLEHIPDPGAVLRNVTRRCWVSIPIFNNAEHVLKSKHYRKDEHIWYFTAPGLVRYMRMHGFEYRDHCVVESDLGREDIQTFYFERPTK